MGYGTKISSIKNENNNNIFLSLELDKKYVIRILPSIDGENTFFEAWIHYRLGEPFLCPKRHFNKSCPACEFVQKFYSDKQISEEMKKSLSFLFPKKRYFMNVYVRYPELEEKVRIWGVSKTAFSQITGYMLSEEYGDVTDTDNGFDFSAMMTKANGQQYPHLELMPKRIASPLAKSGAEVEEIMKKIHDLRSAVPTVASEEIKRRLADVIAPLIGGGKEEDSEKETSQNAVSEQDRRANNAEDDDIPF